ncbi:hypothetical protein VB796_01140 [Arcicella sp. LKC2W]|uniref:hypothetical protein n=1 Tax=Arcicella sp. LKC2W TaxID=2984198 RepID=UPI002B1F7106|nr:hypothetical protein [Arcicella sp. LKC2W]MEA5457620.1 hypothetical protein [Arcicella sp. LKC2W]
MSDVQIEKKLGEVLIKITNFPNDKMNYVYAYTNWGYVQFHLGLSRYSKHSDHFKVSLNASVRIIEIEKYWDDMASLLDFNTVPDVEYKSDRLKVLDGPETFIMGPLSCFNSIDELHEALPMFKISKEGFENLENTFKLFYHEKFIPKLKETLDLKFLDSTINSKVEYLGGNASDYFLNIVAILLRRMVLAKLTNNPLYEEICEFNRGIVMKLNSMPLENRNNYQKNFPEVFEKVYNRLKTVKPLENYVLELDII